MDSSKFRSVIVAIFALFCALYLGVTAATAQIETVLWVLGTILFIVCISLGKKIFLILPVSISIALALPLPGNFSTGLIAQGVFLCFVLLLFFTRKLPVQVRISELELLGLLLISTVIQTYVREPVGLNIMGSDSVGAKPYIVVFVNAITAAILSMWIVSPNDLKTWTKLSMLGSILNFGTSMIGLAFPSAGYYLGASFGGDLNDTKFSADGGATRVSFLRSIAYAVANWVSSRRNPLTACFNPLFAILILFAVISAGLSGYRSALIYTGMLLFVGVCYRGRINSVIIAIFSLVGCLVMVTLVNSITPLPVNIQRSLTFLPGTWDTSLKEDSKTSTAWRVDMWKEALFTERWIKNKLLGDGLGFTRDELRKMQDIDVSKLNLISQSGLTYQQESLMITGGYHSGPVQTVRTTGYVGLIILLVFMIRVAVHAHRQIVRCRNTEWWPVSLFIGGPLIVLPIFWTFVFGTFNDGVAEVLIGAALVRMLEKNLPIPPS